MVGNETLAIVVSSTCMNVASARPTVVNPRFGGRKYELMRSVQSRPVGAHLMRDSRRHDDIVRPSRLRCAPTQGEGCQSAVLPRLSCTIRLISACAAASCCLYTVVVNTGLVGACCASMS